MTTDRSQNSIYTLIKIHAALHALVVCCHATLLFTRVAVRDTPCLLCKEDHKKVGSCFYRDVRCINAASIVVVRIVIGISLSCVQESFREKPNISHLCRKCKYMHSKSKLLTEFLNCTEIKKSSFGV